MEEKENEYTINDLLAEHHDFTKNQRPEMSTDNWFLANKIVELQNRIIALEKTK